MKLTTRELEILEHALSLYIDEGSDAIECSKAEQLRAKIHKIWQHKQAEDAKVQAKKLLKSANAGPSFYGRFATPRSEEPKK